MKHKTFLIPVALIALFIAGCSQGQNVQDQNKVNANQTAANKVKDINGLMQANSASTQTLSTTNSNTNVNADTNVIR